LPNHFQSGHFSKPSVAEAKAKSPQLKTQFSISLKFKKEYIYPRCDTFVEIVKRQGDKIGRIYAYWEFVYFGQFF
jgi:hypothetical protein